MAILLFRLRNVPEDEAEAIRDLLRQHDIPFYETSAGNWQISMPAIWLTRDEQFTEARCLIDAYQQQRSRLARQAYEQRKARGEQPTLMQNFRENPVQFSGYMALLILVAYLSLKLFPGWF